MDMEKQNWIEEVINSGSRVRKLAPRDSLFDAIEARVAAAARVPARKVWMAAASVAILMTINFIAISKLGKANTNEPVASESPIYTNNQLY